MSHQAITITTRFSHDEVMRWKAARTGIILFCLFAFGSYLYTLIRGEYNGDFYLAEVTLPASIVFFNFICTVTPFYVLWALYKAFKKRTPSRKIPISMRFFDVFIIVHLLLSLLATLFYGVGVLGKEMYSAPAAIAPFIIVLNKIQPFYLGVLYILISPRESKNQWLVIILMIILGISRASLSPFMYIGLGLLFKYHDKFVLFIKRKKIVIFSLLAVSPFFVGALYELRNTLRGEQQAEIVMSAADIITAKLIGRLSSFSNSAMILEQLDYFEANRNKLETFYFQKQVLTAFMGVGVAPAQSPEKLLISIDSDENLMSTFMTGPQGNIFVSFIKAPATSFMNLATMLLVIFASFFLANHLGTPWANEFTLLLLLYPMVSGVGQEFGGVMASIIAFCILFSLHNAVTHTIQDDLRGQIRLPSKK